MIEDRRELDKQVSERDAIGKITADLGLRSVGKHFFCPGCQPLDQGRPDLVIKDGWFRCFRCGAEGDVVGLVKLARGCDLETAMEWLERETGAGNN